MVADGTTRLEPWKWPWTFDDSIALLFRAACKPHKPCKSSQASHVAHGLGNWRAPQITNYLTYLSTTTDQASLVPYLTARGGQPDGAGHRGRRLHWLAWGREWAESSPLWPEESGSKVHMAHITITGRQSQARTVRAAE